MSHLNPAGLPSCSLGFLLFGGEENPLLFSELRSVARSLRDRPGKPVGLRTYSDVSLVEKVASAMLNGFGGVEFSC